jgi:hypothetical protein
MIKLAKRILYYTSMPSLNLGSLQFVCATYGNDVFCLYLPIVLVLAIIFALITLCRCFMLDESLYSGTHERMVKTC